MSPEAEAAVAEFAADCGTDSHQMQNSCETFLQRYLRDFPAEQELLIAALRVGVPKRIAAVEDFTNYDDFLSDLATKFEKAVHTDTEAAKWTVGAWAYVLGRPAGYAGPEQLENDGKVYHDPTPNKYEGAVQAVMAMIVVAGGFLGSALGVGLPPLVMLAVDYEVDRAHGLLNPGDGGITLAMVLFFLMIMFAAGVVGALGALAGWMVGKGDDRPWTGFGVAFGTGFTTGLLLLFFFSIVIKPFVLFGTLFGAVYKCAARGGH
jgi:hypothetical protein